MSSESPVELQILNDCTGDDTKIIRTTHPPPTITLKQLLDHYTSLKLNSRERKKENEERKKEKEERKKEKEKERKKEIQKERKRERKKERKKVKERVKETKTLSSKSTPMSFCLTPSTPV